jgi:alanine racemase
VKADAYGHGAVPIARRLEKEGTDQFGVAMLEEGIELRRAGISVPVLILGAFDPSQLTMIIEASLTPSVYSAESLTAVLEAGRKLPQPIRFHLKVDTGMGRLGFMPHDLGPILDRIAALPQPALEGIYTALSTSEQPDSPFTLEQMHHLKSAVQEAKRRGLSPTLTHAANSGGILNTPDTWLEMVRPGLALYGLPPAEGPVPRGLTPVLSMHTRIVLLKRVPEGTPLGYGGAFRTSRRSRIATITAGYDDGLNRLLHDGGEVLVRGRRARIAGRISMDLATIDVTEIPEAVEGDVVTILGEQEGERLTVWDLARQCRTIPWEILCGIGTRVPRIYVGEGAERPIRSRFD